MDGEQEEILRDLSDTLGRLNKMIEDISRRQVNSSASTITVSAGGIGMWLAVTCAIVGCLASAGAASIALYGLYRTDRNTDYLQAIYAQAPQLKPHEASK